MNDEPRREELLLHALGALEGPERDAIDAHLAAGCAHCAAELTAAQDTLAELALALDPVEPGPAVRERLLARLATGRSSTSRTSRRRTRRLRRALAAGLAALLAAGAAAVLVERRLAAPARERARALEAELATLSDERDELLEQREEHDAELATLEEALDAANEAIRFLRTPGVQAVDLAATPSQPAAAARVFWEWKDYACYLHARGLAAPAPKRIYALWLHTERGTELVGSFAPDGGGEATLFARLPRDVPRVVQTTVTEEAEPVGDEPSGPVQLAAQVDDPRPAQ